MRRSIWPQSFKLQQLPRAKSAPSCRCASENRAECTDPVETRGHAAQRVATFFAMRSRLVLLAANVWAIVLMVCASSCAKHAETDSSVEATGGTSGESSVGGASSPGGETSIGGETSVGGASAAGGTSSTVMATQVPGALVSFLGDSAYPDDFWTTATLAESNVDEAGLKKAVERIAVEKLEIHGFLLARHGRLIFEQYGWKTGANADDPDKSKHQVVPTERHPLHSTTKSIVSTLVGIALKEGLFPNVDDLVLPHFPEYQPLADLSADKEAMTLEDVLTMRSGLKWTEGDADYVAVLDAPDPARVMLSRPLIDTPVGTVWNYSTGGSEIIAALLRKVTGKTPLEYANEKLFAPLGITKVSWAAASNGTNHGGYGISLSPREMARLGELYRNLGEWKQQRVVPQNYAEVATKAHCTTPWSGEYGYHFWVPGLPGFFGTRGAYGQNIYVSRELGLVAVFTSDLPIGSADSKLDSLMRSYIIPAIK